MDYIYKTRDIFSCYNTLFVTMEDWTMCSKYYDGALHDIQQPQHNKPLADLLQVYCTTQHTMQPENKSTRDLHHLVDLPKQVSRPQKLQANYSTSTTPRLARTWPSNHQVATLSKGMQQ